MKQIRFTAEVQALLVLACMGRYLANKATDQRLATQHGCYGGFFAAFAHAIHNACGSESRLALSIVDADLDIADHDTIPQQIKRWVAAHHDDYEIVLL